jgi:hypothetical protein
MSDNVSTGLISFLKNVWEFISLKEERITKLFPGITENDKNSIGLVNGQDLQQIIRMSIAWNSKSTRWRTAFVQIRWQRNRIRWSEQLSEGIFLLIHQNVYLKVVSIKFMLWNLNHLKLCNGTWLPVKKLIKNVIQTMIKKENV